MIELKTIRKKTGISQTKLAKLIGITQQQYSRYETNTNKVPLETFLKILTACNLKIEIRESKKDKK